MADPKNIYAFELGHQPHISTAEIKAVFSAKKIKYQTISESKKYLILETYHKFDAEEIMLQLGGTVKITKLIPTIKNIENTLVELMKDESSKIHFSVSSKNTGIKVKKELKQLGKSVRYIEPKNSATIIHNNLVKRGTDFTIINNKIYQTVAIQPIEEFSKRDYDRPGFDTKSGMLPPKLARIMINLSQANTKSTLLDPFCGSGTVLTEALTLGFKTIIGSDISSKATEDTRNNIEWIKENNPEIEDVEERVFISDATHIDKKLKPESIDLIVSEPYLGKPLHGKETREQMEKQTSELKRLYANSFRSFKKILKKDAVVIFIIPKFDHDESWITINCVDEIKKIGFNQIPFTEKEKTLVYHRPKQHLAREIFKFSKK